MTKDEMVGWHHQLDGHEFELARGDSERQGSLVCCSPWGHKESYMTEGQNNNNMVSVYDISLAWKQKLSFDQVKLYISSHSAMKERCFKED